MPDWVVWLAGVLGPAIAAVWLFITRVWFPEQAKIRDHQRQMLAESEQARRRDEARDHEHRREQAEAAAAAEQAEQLAVWAQMTQLQSQALRQNEMLLGYIVNDLKSGQDRIAEETRKMIYSVREIQAKMSILISLITEDYEHRRQRQKRDTVEIPNPSSN